MIIALIAAAAQTTAMMTTADRVRAPVIAPMNPSTPALTPVPAVPVRILVMAGGRQLFNDTFRVARNSGASYSENRSEAPEMSCGGDRYSGSQERYSLNINLYLREDIPTGPAVNVSVNWQRATRGIECGEEGTRGVQLTQTVPLAPGQSVTLEGDAGLAVTVSR